MILRCSNEDDDLVLGAFLFIHLDMYEEYEVRWYASCGIFCEDFLSLLREEKVRNGAKALPPLFLSLTVSILREYLKKARA